MGWFGRVLLAFVLSQLAMAVSINDIPVMDDSTSDIPELAVNMTFQPVPDIVQFVRNWTIARGPDDSFFIRGFVRPQDDASVQFSAAYTGTAIYLNGRVTEDQVMAVETVKNNRQTQNLTWTSSQRTLMFSGVGDGVKRQNMVGFIRPRSPTSAWFDVNSVTITTLLRTQAPTFEQMQKAAEPFFVKGRRTGLNPRFEWSPEQNEGSEGWGSDGTAATTTIASSSVKIEIPDQTSLVVVNGTRGPNKGHLNASISPTPPYWDEGGEILRNLGMAIERPNQPILYAVLDPTVQYTMVLATLPERKNNNGQGSNSALRFSSLTYYFAPWNQTTTEADSGTSEDTPSGASGNDTAKSSSMSVPGIIAGSTIGGIVVVGLVIWGILHLATRRARRQLQKRMTTDKGTFQIDTDAEGLLAAPFVSGRHSHRGYALESLTSGESATGKEETSESRATDAGQLPPSYDPSWTQPWAPDSTSLPPGMAPALVPEAPHGLSSAVSSGVSRIDPTNKTGSPEPPSSEEGEVVPPPSAFSRDRKGPF